MELDRTCVLAAPLPASAAQASTYGMGGLCLFPLPHMGPLGQQAGGLLSQYIGRY